MSAKKGTEAIIHRTAAGPAAALPAGCPEFLEDIKSRIRTAQIKASLSASRELILLYWDLGKSIIDRDILRRLKLVELKGRARGSRWHLKRAG